MTTKITCVHCGDFFQIVQGEADEFIRLHADKDFLAKFPFPLELKRAFRTKRRYFASLLEVYCPYCRAVEFSFPHSPKFPKCTTAPDDRPRITDDEYLEMTEQEMHRMGGFQFRKISEGAGVPINIGNKK